MTSEEVSALVKGVVFAVRRRVREMGDGLVARQALLERQITQVVEMTKEIGTMRERLAVLETRAAVPGPPGPPGHDGSDGVGFDDLAIEQLDDRSIVVKAMRGETVKVIGSVRFPIVSFEGDHDAAREYTAGQIVRHKSALYVCTKATMVAPGATTYDATGQIRGPQGHEFWKLLLRDGKR